MGHLYVVGTRVLTEWANQSELAGDFGTHAVALTARDKVLRGRPALRAARQLGGRVEVNPAALCESGSILDWEGVTYTPSDAERARAMQIICELESEFVPVSSDLRAEDLIQRIP